eukprot:1085534-Pleurochrysis_carterae.AAC.1
MAIRVEDDSEEEDYDVMRLDVADVLDVRNEGQQQKPSEVVVCAEESFDIPLMFHDTGLAEALADDRLNLDQVVNKVFIRLRTWAKREQIMPQYGLMCRSL